MHSDYYALTLLNHAFGGQFTSRLNMNLRESKGYTYGYHSNIDWLRDASTLVVGGGVHTAVTKEAVIETLREFEDLGGRHPLSQEEFDTAKVSILRGMPGMFETAGDVLDRLVEMTLFDLPDNYYDTFATEVQLLSLQDVLQVANDWSSDTYLKILVVGDRRVVEQPLRELGFPVVPLTADGELIE